MYSREGLPDFKNEIYVISDLGRAQLLLHPAILEYLSTGDKLRLLSLGPIYLLPQFRNFIEFSLGPRICRNFAGGKNFS